VPTDTRVRRARAAWWNHPAARALAYQALAIGGVIALAWYLIDNTLANLATRRIATGFDFLGREAGFAISEHLIDYSAEDSYARAYVVGLLNTLSVSVLGIVLATIIGVLVGIARLSSNFLVARLATAYVETLRNVPLLLQLMVWYGLLIALPGPRQALEPIAGVFLTGRGLYYPVLAAQPALGAMLALAALGALAALALYRYSRNRQLQTGAPLPLLWPAVVGSVLVPPLIAYLGAGEPLTLDRPELTGFNFTGGGALSPEFAAMLFGLVTYTATFIAEVVRAGILAVSRGQWEAARALGLQPGRTLKLVVLPQALRVIVPPLTNQYLNLTKNSSLAVGIGYPDLVSVANTTINQTGQAIEGITLMMAVYLTLSLAISLSMNWYDARPGRESR
jgi:general L-amino acid transport system permease protein